MINPTAVWLILGGLAAIIGGASIIVTDHYEAREAIEYRDARLKERKRGEELRELQAERLLQENQAKGGPEPLNDFARGPGFNEPTLATEWPNDPGPASLAWPPE